MDLRTKRTICLLIGIASILTIVSTISYAYFTAMADLNPIESIINTSTVSAKFSDYGAEVGGTLGFGESITKRFTIENTGTAEAKVKMYWVDLINTYTKGSLTYTLSYSENETGSFTEVKEKTNVPQSKSSSKKELVNSLTIPVGKTYYYNLVITLNYLEDENQDADLEAIFNSKFGIEDINYVVSNPSTNMIAANQGVRTNFGDPALTDEGVFEMEDDYGTSYYYRGAVENNYVKFGKNSSGKWMWWRIIRLNGDGSLRIQYDGVQGDNQGENEYSRGFTHTGQAYNVNYDDAKYVGWMYGPAGTTASTSKSQAQSNMESSSIKKVVDAWYKTNIVDMEYGDAVSDTLFCNDRSISDIPKSWWTLEGTVIGYGKKVTAYGSFHRFKTESGSPRKNCQPTFKCTQKNDAFTVSDTTKGNGALEHPVGLITSDEIVAAGSGTSGTNSKYYLYKDAGYWSFSPYYNNNATLFLLYANGSLTSCTVTDKYAVAPVINLTPEYVSTMFGDGTMNNPYRAE